MLVHGVHGWGETDRGDGSVARLYPYMLQAGATYAVFEHVWPRLKSLALLQQRRRTQEEAERLADRLRDGEGLVTYSNGAAVAGHALQRRPDIRVPVWVIVAGALRRDYEFPPNVNRVIVLHSDSDLALIAGWLWTWINPAAWVLGHDWGLLGRVGYRGDDPRVENWPARKDKTVRHLGWFDKEPMAYWGPRIAAAFTFKRTGQ